MGGRLWISISLGTKAWLKGLGAQKSGFQKGGISGGISCRGSWFRDCVSRDLTVCCTCSERQMLPGRGALTPLRNSKESHRVMRPGHHILCHLLVCPLPKFPGLEICLGQCLSLWHLAWCFAHCHRNTTSPPPSFLTWKKILRTRQSSQLKPLKMHLALMLLVFCSLGHPGAWGCVVSLTAYFSPWSGEWELQLGSHLSQLPESRSM